jgi:hypothetical protein
MHQAVGDPGGAVQTRGVNRPVAHTPWRDLTTIPFILEDSGDVGRLPESSMILGIYGALDIIEILADLFRSLIKQTFKRGGKIGLEWIAQPCRYFLNT